MQRKDSTRARRTRWAMLSGKTKNKYLHACTILCVHFSSKLELGYMILWIFKIAVMVFGKSSPQFAACSGVWKCIEWQTDFRGLSWTMLLKFLDELVDCPHVVKRLCCVLFLLSFFFLTFFGKIWQMQLSHSMKICGYPFWIILRH